MGFTHFMQIVSLGNVVSYFQKKKKKKKTTTEKQKTKKKNIKLSSAEFVLSMVCVNFGSETTHMMSAALQIFFFFIIITSLLCFKHGWTHYCSTDI